MSDTTPPNTHEEPFQMLIEQVIFVRTNGGVIVGHVETGYLRKDDSISIRGETTSITTKAKDFEMWRKEIDMIQKGDHVAILLPRDILPEQVQVGMVITTEGA